MTNIYIKWIWWEAETDQMEVPVLVYSAISPDDYEIERFALYRKDRVWGYCNDPMDTGRTMLSDQKTGIVNPDFGVAAINKHALEAGDHYHLEAISPVEYYQARKTHIGMEMPALKS